jgi:hypothetical protein
MNVYTLRVEPAARMSVEEIRWELFVHREIRDVSRFVDETVAIAYEGEEPNVAAWRQTLHSCGLEANSQLPGFPMIFSTGDANIGLPRGCCVRQTDEDIVCFDLLFGHFPNRTAVLRLPTSTTRPRFAYNAADGPDALRLPAQAIGARAGVRTHLSPAAASRCSSLQRRLRLLAARFAPGQLASAHQAGLLIPEQRYGPYRASTRVQMSHFCHRAVHGGGTGREPSTPSSIHTHRRRSLRPLTAMRAPVRVTRVLDWPRNT